MYCTLIVKVIDLKFSSISRILCAMLVAEWVSNKCKINKNLSYVEIQNNEWNKDIIKRQFKDYVTYTILISL